MQKEDKERVVSELTDKLRNAETLIVADYRGLTMPQIDALRGKLIENGAKLSVVKNTLTRRAVTREVGLITHSLPRSGAATLGPSRPGRARAGRGYDA